MDKPKVVNVKSAELKKLGYKNLQEWLKDSNHVYVGRDMTWAVKGAKGSKWQNPFKINDYGLEECLKNFEEYLMKNNELLKDIHELKGKDLGCWCVPYHGCHAEILLKIANQETKEEIQVKEQQLFNDNFPKLDTNPKSDKLPPTKITYKDKL